MARAKANNNGIKKTDGRKNNGGARGGLKMDKIRATTTALNEAKKDRMKIYALNAMKEVFGSEENAWKELATKAKESFQHMNLLWQYRYGKPTDNRSEDTNKKLNVPVINFFASPQQVQNLENTIDITPEEEDVDVDELNKEDE